MDSLHDICAMRIPDALGMTAQCSVERAHRLGAPSNDRLATTPIIVCYLNYADRFNILRLELQIFPAGWPQTSTVCGLLPRGLQQTQSFPTHMCCSLQKGQTYLAYPAILSFTDPSGDSKSFSHPKEAMNFLQAYLHIPMPPLPLHACLNQGTNAAQKKTPPRESISMTVMAAMESTEKKNP